jgi:hypothetical protein
MNADLLASLEGIVRKQLAGAQIDAVDIVEDFDSDGDRVLRVTIIFESKTGLDPAKAKGLVRHMRSTLEERDSFTFPLVAFRSRADQKRLKAEAA